MSAGEGLLEEVKPAKRSRATGRRTVDGVWMAYYDDWSAIAIFPTELEALRHAMGSTMKVEWRGWGEIR